MGWFSHDCKTDGHRTEARYHDQLNKIIMDRFTELEGNLNQLRERIYVHDICTRCGAIFQKKDTTDG